MSRCSRTIGLEVHHKRIDGGNSLDNAEVLCQRCHDASSISGEQEKSLTPFEQETKNEAFRRAKNQCECTRTSECH
jgi:hypothetical protein